MSTGIFQRPNLDQYGYLLPMRISGIPPEYVYLEPYEMRLQVHHNVGSCTIKQTGGDRLPNGHSLSFDADTNEIVLSWPKLTYVDPVTKIYAAEIMDPGFESGSMKKGWEAEHGWTVNNINNITGSYSACFMDFNGSSHIVNKARHVVEAGTVINAQCTVRQGASAKYNAGALVTLRYYDEDNNMMHIDRGNLVDDGAKNETHISRVKSTAPIGAKTVSIGCEGVRFKENKELFVDDFKWDLQIKEVIVSDNPLDEYYIELTATDTIGRIARWSGKLYDDSIYFTSKPYPIYQMEAVGIGAGVGPTIERSWGVNPQRDVVSIGASFSGFTRRLTVNKFTAETEGTSIGASFTAFTRKLTVNKFTADQESTTIGASFSKLTRKTHPHVYIDVHSTSIGASFNSITRSKP